MTVSGAYLHKPSGASSTLTRSRQTVSVIAVLAFFVALVMSYYWLVIVGLRDTSWIGVGMAFVLGSDGLLLVLSVGRRDRSSASAREPDPGAVSVIISCYNGAAVIGETIEHVLAHVPPHQVIVVSDTSTDNTVEVARSYGVVVVENRMNRNKALSINRAALMVRTEFTLILDDDTHVGADPLPVDLLREGAAAVAFDVMPKPDGTLVNKTQVYEYRKAMILGKALLSSSGAISNVSGAVGLFRTRDLRQQATRHSGHFAGEDLQRTLLAHLTSDGAGIAFCSSRVETLPPDTWRSLFQQRAYKWGTADHEMFVLNFRLLFNPRAHYALRMERAYSVFVLLTDPLRMAFFLSLLLRPWYFVFLYFAFLPLEVVAWLRLRRADPLPVVLLAPAYNLFKMLARFVGHFYWFRSKWSYLRRRYHRLVPGRNLLAEYAMVTISLVTAWTVTLAAAVVMLKRDTNIAARSRVVQADATPSGGIPSRTPHTSNTHIVRETAVRPTLTTQTTTAKPLIASGPQAGTASPAARLTATSRSLTASPTTAAPIATATQPLRRQATTTTTTMPPPASSTTTAPST